ncbi:ABC transporter substrate-binding protein [Pleionea sp. CnH1-48]|uniref:substrate-binding periplasmic protein n=1 Tax=Pleionea sp. CnH1-48 TaxID=2954494 RepID=UPI002096BBFF|nr:transporter substrate-binding domain-containing protein [Pleionea sp. CnH1-48]MCO7227178.1 transporter substrate-binding domain-containing protein [Pleionea sp. CnH1-48]
MLKHFAITILLTVLLIPLVLAAKEKNDKVIYLTSLDWPPYTTHERADQGASAAVARAAFAAVGYRLHIDIYPWSRAVKLGLSDRSKYAGYFPEYYSSKLHEYCHLSNPMGSGPLGFAQRISSPVQWNTLNDIARQSKIGVVQDYINTTEFDRRVANGNIKVETATSDARNLQKLAAGRFPLIVIDKNVMSYLLNNNKHLLRIRDKVSFNKKTLENKKLYICFKKTANSRLITEIFNEGLKRIDIDQVFSKALKDDTLFRQQTAH